MEERETMEENRCIVMFPFMGQGHIIPFLALALQIEQRGYPIIFVNTPLNIAKLRRSIPPTSSIRLAHLPFNSSDHGLPPDSENTDVLPYSLVLQFLEASTTLRPAFRSLLADLTRDGPPPLCVVADIFFGWSAEVAHELGLFHVIFSGAGGFGLACYHSVWLNLPHLASQSAEFTSPDFPEAGRFHVTQLAASYLQADGKDGWSVFQHRNLSAWANSDGLLFNTVEDLDRIGLSYFRRQLKRPIWAVGPVLLLGDDRSRLGKQAGITLEQCLDWLDTKSPNSVLYISFGSMNTISASQMVQLAKALEQVRNVNFIWVVRPPLGFDITAEFRAEDWLPEGFIDNVVEDQKRGIVVVQWAPQVEILSHKAVGAFVTHCGWNSVLEALSRSVRKTARSSAIPIPININATPRKEQSFNDGLTYSELWAGPAYSNSPPPSSLPMPKFSLRPKRTVSLELPFSPPCDIDFHPIAKSAPPSPTRNHSSSSGNLFDSADSATRTLRRMLNLDISDE